MLYRGDSVADHTRLQAVSGRSVHTTPMEVSVAQEATTRFPLTSPNRTTLIIQTDLDD